MARATQIQVDSLSLNRVINITGIRINFVTGPSGFEPETAGFLRWIKVRYSTWLSYGPSYCTVIAVQFNFIHSFDLRDNKTF